MSPGPSAELQELQGNAAHSHTRVKTTSGFNIKHVFVHVQQLENEAWSAGCCSYYLALAPQMLSD